MPVRTQALINDHYYHVYNRGVAKQPIFLKPKHYRRFQKTLQYYSLKNPPLRLSRYLSLTIPSQTNYLLRLKQQKSLVHIIAYCLMPNHFHLLIKQTQNHGISELMRLLSNSYTKYFNTVNNRVGPVFQGPFKSVHVDSDIYLLHLSRYIHLNPVESNLINLDKLDTYPYSSYSQYLHPSFPNPILVDLGIILDQFTSPQDYLAFCTNLNDYSESLNFIKPHLLDV